MIMWAEFIWLKTGTSDRFCEHVNEFLGSVTEDEYLCWRTNSSLRILLFGKIMIEM
jgi:hypothetical protein